MYIQKHDVNKLQENSVVFPATPQCKWDSLAELLQYPDCMQ